jgi:hypothetical protein
MPDLRTITITAWKRPHYLRKALECLHQNVLTAPPGKPVTDWKLYCFLEPGCPETVKVCEEFAWNNKVIVVNRRKLGVRENPYTALSRVFNDDSKMNIYLEEDIVISRDATKLVEWFWDQTRTNQERWLSLNFLAYDSNPKDPVGLVESKRFNALGMAITKPAWERWFKPNWHNDARSKAIYGKTYHGWDWAITSMMAHEKPLTTLTPVFSRSNHIGRDNGVHATPSFHDQTFEGLPINQDPNPGEYVIRRTEAPGQPRPDQNPS